MAGDALAASFRDPSGFLFRRDGVLYRQINQRYRPDYELLMSSGLYSALTEQGLLVAHEEADIPPEVPVPAWKVIRPEMVPFISYPYEWSFGQLQDAALATLEVQKTALKHGMSLKDASAYNIQFVDGRPGLIDTLSFETYVEGCPWVAYRQFCQHFLAPLALMSRRDVRLGQLMRVYIDGVPLDLASELLPWRTRFNFSLAAHIHMHARSQRRFSDHAVDVRGRKVSRLGLEAIIDSLESCVKGLRWKPAGTEWGNYYNATNYSGGSFEHKRRLVGEFLDQARPSSVWDLGANTGVFSRLASERGIPTVAFDIDPAAVEICWREVRANGTRALLPLQLDLTNPSPGLGWAEQERDGWLQRGPVDLVMALALVHHLAISNNVPLARLAKLFRQAGRWLVIEFVPKTDSQVQRLLATREDIFPDYRQDAFEEAFAREFEIRESHPVEGSERVLYLMRGRED